MAMADYRLCDKCGCKAFYDSNLNYEFEDRNTKIPDDEKIRDFPYKLDYLGDWAVLCRDCAKKFRCVIETIDGLGVLTLKQIIEARDTKIAMLQGIIRALTETAAENSKIKSEDHQTICRYREAREAGGVE